MKKLSELSDNDRKRVGLTISRIVVYAFLILLSFISLIFFWLLFVNATRLHSEIMQGFSLLPGKSIARNFRSMLNSPIAPVISGMFNSLLVSSGVTVLACYFSCLTAFAIHAYDFKLKQAAFVFILAIMVIPTQISASGFVRLMNQMGLSDSFIPLIVPAIASPVVFFFMKQYMEAALPVEIIEAARIDGSSEFYSFNRIVLPIMMPALAVQGIIVFVGSWNNYFVPALLLESDKKKTLPIIIAQLRSADFTRFDMGQLYMTIAFSILPIIVVYFILSKYIVQGVAMGSVKG